MDEQTKARIGKVIEWLCIPEGTNRHRFLTEEDRVRFIAEIVKRVTSMSANVQCRLIRVWLRLVMNEHRNKELAEALIKNAADEVYASSHLEKWAETRLIRKTMKITPRKLAQEYAILLWKSDKLTGIYVRDMQRVKERLLKRIARKKTPENLHHPDVMPQRPRFKRTARQEAKRTELVEGSKCHNRAQRTN